MTWPGLPRPGRTWYLRLCLLRREVHYVHGKCLARKDSAFATVVEYLDFEGYDCYVTVRGRAVVYIAVGYRARQRYKYLIIESLARLGSVYLTGRWLALRLCLRRGIRVLSRQVRAHCALCSTRPMCKHLALT